MVLLTTTTQILKHISALPPVQLSILQSSSSDPLPIDTSSPISHHALITLARLLQENISEDFTKPLPNPKHASSKETEQRPASLNTLLRGVKPYKPLPPPKPQPTPEYIALMARLRAEAEQREYQAFLAQESATSFQIHNGGIEDDEDPISPSQVLNIFISVVFCALAVFYLTRWWSNDGVRVLLSLATGIVVGIAEAVVYAGYIRNVKRGRAQERAKKEKKTPMGEYREGGDAVEAWGKTIALSQGSVGSVVRRNTDGDDIVTVEREVIWGKGKHGGMRRRVREKWEKENE